MGNKQPSFNFKHDEPIKRALLMGFDYSGRNVLQGPINDIRLADQVLSSTYEFKHIYMVTDGDIGSTLRSFIASSIDGDISVIHYSGHGEYTGGTNVLVEEDLDLITSKEITELFRVSKGRFLVVIDSCDSGRMVKLPNNYDPNLNVITTMDGLSTDNSDVLFFSSSERTQDAYESTHEGRIFGNFSYLFYRLIRDKPDMIWIDIFNQIYKKLKNQHPMLSSDNVQLFYQSPRNYI